MIKLTRTFARFPLGLASIFLGNIFIAVHLVTAPPFGVLNLFSLLGVFFHSLLLGDLFRSTYDQEGHRPIFDGRLRGWIRERWKGLVVGLGLLAGSSCLFQHYLEPNPMLLGFGAGLSLFALGIFFVPAIKWVGKLLVQQVRVLWHQNWIPQPFSIGSVLVLLGISLYSLYGPKPHFGVAILGFFGAAAMLGSLIVLSRIVRDDRDRPIFPAGTFRESRLFLKKLDRKAWFLASLFWSLGAVFLLLLHFPVKNILLDDLIALTLLSAVCLGIGFARLRMSSQSSDL